MSFNYNQIQNELGTFNLVGENLMDFHAEPGTLPYNGQRH